MPADLKDGFCTPDRTVVAVEVLDKRNGAVHYWSVPKLLYVCLCHSDHQEWIIPNYLSSIACSV